VAGAATERKATLEAMLYLAANEALVTAALVAKVAREAKEEQEVPVGTGETSPMPVLRHFST